MNRPEKSNMVTVKTVCGFYPQAVFKVEIIGYR